jgi:hypothetical protein
MKPRLSFLALAFGISASGCVLYHERAEIREAKDLEGSGIRKLQVSTQNGKVVIRCVERASGVAVTYTRFANGATEEEARENAAEIDVDLERDTAAPDLLRLAARVPAGLARYSAGVHFEVEMPPGADIEVVTANGRVAVEGARGRVDVKSSNGKLEFKDIRGPLEARTSNGEIVATDVRGDANLKSSNGAITFTSDSLPTQPRIKADTSNGAVHVEVPSSVRARLALKTSNGGIEQRLPGVSLSNLETSRNRLEAVLNGGGGEIAIETSNGKIRFETVP